MPGRSGTDGDGSGGEARGDSGNSGVGLNLRGRGILPPTTDRAASPSEAGRDGAPLGEGEEAVEHESEQGDDDGPSGRAGVVAERDAVDEVAARPPAR